MDGTTSLHLLATVEIVVQLPSQTALALSQLLATVNRNAFSNKHLQVAISLRGGVSDATVTMLVRVVVDTARVTLVADPPRLAVVLPPGGATNVRITITNNGNVPSG